MAEEKVVDINSYRQKSPPPERDNLGNTSKIVNFSNRRDGIQAGKNLEKPLEADNLVKVRREVAGTYQTSQGFQKRNRVQTKDFILMIGTALFYDSLQILISLIPYVGWILSPVFSIFAGLTFFLWNAIKGWGSSKTRKQFIIKWFLPAIELIPILNVLPVWTLRVLLQLIFLKGEDAVYNASKGNADVGKISSFYKKIA